MMVHAFTQLVIDKGYTAAEVAKRWGVLPRQFSKIAAAPKQIHFDALAGLPVKDDKV